MADPINFEALYNMLMAKDPRGIQAARNLTPDEAQGFFDWQKAQQPKGDMAAGSPDRNVLDFKGADGVNLGLAPEALAGGAAALGANGVSGAISAAQSMAAKHPILTGIAGMKALQMLGLPPWVYPLLTMGKAGTPAAFPGILEEAEGMAGAKGPSNLLRQGPGSGASADQVGEMTSRHIHDYDALGMTAPGRPAAGGGTQLRSPSPFSQPPEFSNPGAGRLPENPFGLNIPNSQLFKTTQALESDLKYSDPAEEEKIRQALFGGGAEGASKVRRRKP